MNIYWLLWSGWGDRCWAKLRVLRFPSSRSYFRDDQFDWGIAGHRHGVIWQPYHPVIRQRGSRTASDITHRRSRGLPMSPLADRRRRMQSGLKYQKLRALLLQSSQRSSGSARGTKPPALNSAQNYKSRFVSRDCASATRTAFSRLVEKPTSQ